MSAVTLLGIETSCDETSAAIVVDGRDVRANVVSSQVKLHEKYGGIVPEIASRAHIENIQPIVEETLAAAGMRYSDLDAVAVTAGPGLVGSLLIGVTAAKTLALACDLPLVPVDHIEAHATSAALVTETPPWPAVALVVSGGHTSLYLVRDFHEISLLGQTVDDAAGEAFDKVAAILELGYPGGPLIDKLAQGGNPKAVRFPRTWINKPHSNFSFSGLKTAVRRLAQREELVQASAVGGEVSPRVLDLVASFQKAVVDALLETTLRACRREDVRTVLVGGGVACNARLRRAFREASVQHGLRVFIPSPDLTTDNAAMIAAAGFLHLERGRHAGLDLNADPNLRL
jgi:N6-L-threonylcarbamoyladenine synthase